MLKINKNRRTYIEIIENYVVKCVSTPEVVIGFDHFGEVQSRERSNIICPARKSRRVL
jgi:hypothetical protein